MDRNEAIKIVKSHYPANKQMLNEALEFLIPELAESEDERIRKALIDYFNPSTNLSDYKFRGEFPLEHVVAWLEKQEGCEYIKKDWLEHIKQSWYKEGFIDGKYSDGTSKEWTKNDAATLKELIDFLENGTAKLQHDLTRYANWLKIQLTPIKKQGNPTDINPSEFDLRLNKLLKQFETLPKEELANSLSFYLNVVQNDGTYKPDEKQGEQKPADKVEPKFKVGDWIAYNHNTNLPPRKIIQIANEHYIFNNGSFEVKTLEADWHLWTIQDAKDGDVLFTSSTASHETFVFKNIDKKGNAKCYFAYDSEDGFREGKYHFIGRATDCKPATKEQRDLLFQKMKEAGYEWDADKKELRKIEQKSADTNFSDLTTWKYIVDAVLTKEHGIGNYLDDPNTEKFAKELQERFGSVEQKLAESIKFNNEFENQVSNLIVSVLNGEHEYNESFVKYVAQSLLGYAKNELKPTEWSEEDEARIKNILSVLDVQVCWDGATGKKGNPYQKEIDWLKSLKDKYTWKPTTEQLRELRCVISGCSFETSILVELEENLKKLL